MVLGSILKTADKGAAISSPYPLKAGTETKRYFHE